MKEIPVGTKGKKVIKVEESMTAAAMCSGALEVFGTPSLCAWIEFTCFSSIEEYLEEGEGTVGTRIELSHLAATPVGMNITIESEVIETEGRKIVFKATAYDDKEKIGEARHERFMIYNEKFMAKAAAKLQ